MESVKHRDKRKNIPTQELGDFVKKDEESPQTLLYPRDPSLDPQLVWKGKDEQDFAAVFDDFNGLEFQKLIDFHHHDQSISRGEFTALRSAGGRRIRRASGDSRPRGA